LPLAPDADVDVDVHVRDQLRETRMKGAGRQQFDFSSLPRLLAYCAVLMCKAMILNSAASPNRRAVLRQSSGRCAVAAKGERSSPVGGRGEISGRCAVAAKGERSSPVGGRGEISGRCAVAAKGAAGVASLRMGSGRCRCRLKEQRALPRCKWAAGDATAD
jgi:hypothetical protein